MAREEESKRRPMVVLLSSPGMGHLIPLAEFATRLADHHHFSVTIFTASDASTPPNADRQLSLPNNVISHPLPEVHLDDVQPARISLDTRIYLTMSRSVPHLRRAMEALAESARVVALVVDLFGAEALAVARELGVGGYIFYPTTCMVLSLFFQLPHLDRTVAGKFQDLEAPIELPGCVPIHGRDLEESLQDREDHAYKLSLHHSRLFMAADGIFVNTFVDIEAGAISGLKDQRELPPVYPVGPLVRIGKNSDPDDAGDRRHECLNWLDEQRAGSVIFVSFGSGGTLSPEQLTELAIGLELSRQKFLWVVRSPSNESDASFFTTESDTDPLDSLPENFVRRTAAAGSYVVRSWAPQAEVLAHPATGGFVTHCGWNSTLEAVVHGVPMVAWPLYAEQRMNAAMLTSEGLALRAEEDEKGVVRRDEVGRVVKELMEGVEGKKVIMKMVELKEKAAMAVAPGGSSELALSRGVSKWYNL